MPDALDPLLLSTAIEVVLHAGEMQIASLGRDLRIDKKGRIDLVTEVDLAIETWFREFLRGRFPFHRILAEEFGAHQDAGEQASMNAGVPAGERTDGARHRWIFDPIDGTTNYAHGLPIFCASLAVEVDDVLTAGAVYDPTRRELFSAERGAGAFLNGQPLRVSQAATLVDAPAVHRLSV